MSTLLRNPEPVLPSQQEAEMARLSSRALAPHLSDQDGLRIRLDDGVGVVLPPSALRLMVDMLAHLSEGNAVTLIPTARLRELVDIL